MLEYVLKIFFTIGIAYLCLLYLDRVFFGGFSQLTLKN